LSRPIDQGRLRLAIPDHRDGPALVVIVLDDARGPAIALPQARLLDRAFVFVFVVFFNLVGHGGHRLSWHLPRAQMIEENGRSGRHAHAR